MDCRYGCQPHGKTLAPSPSLDKQKKVISQRTETDIGIKRKGYRSREKPISVTKETDDTFSKKRRHYGEKATTLQTNQLNEYKTMATRQAEIDRLKALTGKEFTERKDGWLVYDGDINLEGAEIKELEKVEVGGWLDLEGSSIERMKQVKVGGWLNLDNSQIERLEQVKVWVCLNLEGTKIKSLEQVEVGAFAYFQNIRIRRMDLEQGVDE